MNRAAEDLTGWDMEAGRGRPCSVVFRIINEHTREVVESPVERVLRSGRIMDLANHTVLVTRNGKELPIDDSGAPIRAESGTIQGVVLVFRDISDRREAERKVIAANVALKAANEAKDQFIATLSHELRTPLTPVLFTLSLWEGEATVPDWIKKDIPMLRRNIELEAQMIDDLMDLNRIVRGKVRLTLNLVNVHDVIRATVGMYESDFNSLGLAISLQLEARLPFVQADSGRLQQVFGNLLKNATGFTPRGGQIKIRTFNDTDNTVFAAFNDNGIGMSPGTIERLFIPFEQAIDAQMGRTGGLGLGLAISQELVHAHNGLITAESPGLGKGSTFIVRLPCVQDVAQQLAAQKPSESSSKSECALRILLIEDHIDTAAVISRILQQMGHKTDKAHTLADSLRQIENSDYDVIISDLSLPDGTGFEFIERLRQQRQTPVIAITGLARQGDVDKCEAAGFIAHISKPVTVQQLRQTLSRVMPRQENRPAL